VTQLVQRECSAVPSKNQLKPLTQVLPNARIIPRIKFLSRSELKKGKVATDKNVHPDIDDKLFDIALKAYAKANNKPVAYYDDKDKPFAVIFAPARALAAANHFVSEKEFETPLPDFRRLIADTGKASLKRAIVGFLKKIPSDVSPPFPQMRDLAGASEWRNKLNPAMVRRALERWLELMDELSDKTGRGRPPITAEKNFVRVLAHYWEKELGAKPINSRRLSEQSGLFANFIREAAKIIPTAYRPKSWDQAIREVLKKKSRPR
jgi:hypothetical protein